MGYRKFHVRRSLVRRSIRFAPPNDRTNCYTPGWYDSGRVEVSRIDRTRLTRRTQKCGLGRSEVWKLDARETENALRQMDDLLTKFATIPVPDYSGFYREIERSPSLSSIRYLAYAITKHIDRCEHLIDEDQRAGRASEKGFKAFMQYKLVLGLVDKLERRYQEIVEKYKCGDYNEIIKHSEETVILSTMVLDRNREEADAYTLRGFAHARLGNFDDAINDFTKAIGFGTNKTTMYMAYTGRAYTRLSMYGVTSTVGNPEFNSIIEDFNGAEQFISSQGTMLGFYLTRGFIYQQSGELRKAVEDYDSAIRSCLDYYNREFRDDENRWRIFVPGITGSLGFDKRNIVEDIIASLKSHIASAHEENTQYYYRGVKRLFQGDRVSAGRYFRKALELGYRNSDKIAQHLANLN